MRVNLGYVVLAGFLALVAGCNTMNSSGYVQLDGVASGDVNITSTPQFYVNGDKVTFTVADIKPIGTGKYFSRWKDSGGTTLSTDASYTCTYSDQNHITAEFKQIEWNIMVYLDADNSLDEYAILNMNQMEAADLRNTGINIIVLLDRAKTAAWQDSRLYCIEYDGGNSQITSPRVASTELGISATGSATELDMSNTATLKNFVNWAKAAYPATHTMLEFWDHGGGWRSQRSIVNIAPTSSAPSASSRDLVWDATTGTGKCLVTKDLGDTLADGEVDLVGFDLCYLGMIEVAYELRHKASFMVASEEVTPGPGWDYTNLLTKLKNLSDRSPKNFASAIVDAYGETYASQVGTTLAAYDLSKIDALVSALSAWSTEVNNSIFGAATPLTAQADVKTEIFTNTEQFFDFSYGSGFYNLDIYDMAHQVLAGTGFGASTAAALETAVDSLMVKEWHNTSGSGNTANVNAHGIAIGGPYKNGTTLSLLSNYYAYDAASTINLPRFVTASGCTWVPNYTTGDGLLYTLLLKTTFP